MCLESGILPYLEKLMQHLLETLKSTSVIHIKELVISAIGAICKFCDNAQGMNFTQKFNHESVLRLNSQWSNVLLFFAVTYRTLVQCVH